MDLEDAVLAVAQQHELGRLVAEDLPAQLGADGAAGAGDQHALAAASARALGRVGLHRVAPEQVLDLDVAQLADAEFAAQQLVHAGIMRARTPAA